MSERDEGHKPQSLRRLAPSQSVVIRRNYDNPLRRLAMLKLVRGQSANFLYLKPLVSWYILLHLHAQAIADYYAYERIVRR